MKSDIIQASGIIERKRVSAEITEIWNSFTCTSNDIIEIPAEKRNRRIHYFICNNEFICEHEYFKNLCKGIQPQK